MISPQFNNFAHTLPFAISHFYSLPTRHTLLSFNLQVPVSILYPQNTFTFDLPLIFQKFFIHTILIELNLLCYGWLQANLVSLLKCLIFDNGDIIFLNSEAPVLQVYRFSNRLKMSKEDMKITLLYIQKHTFLSYVSSSLIVSLMFKYTAFNLHTLKEQTPILTSSTAKCMFFQYFSSDSI